MMMIAEFSRTIGCDQIQIPFVQGTVVGPIANPVMRLSRRLARKLFPVLCGPAIVTTDIW